MNWIKRREFFRMAGAAGLALAAPVVTRAADAAGGAPEPKRPNILVFLTDDHGQWAQHAYGNSELQTPNFDRLARAGTKMSQAFTTTPVCSPARATFFTGRMPSQHGIHDYLYIEQFPDHPALKGQKLLPEFLSEAGYHTGLVGKWHCGFEHDPQPGFDRWVSYWFGQDPHVGHQNFSDQGQHVSADGEQSPLLTGYVLDFLQKRRSDPVSARQPYFLFVSYVDTHSPHRGAPADLVQKYGGATFRDIPNEEPSPCHGLVLNPKKQPDQERLRQIECYASASSVDREVGRVLDDLQAHGELENTLIVYTGDHGLNCGHHGLWEKGNGTVPQNFLDESIRIPCLVSWPGGGVRQNVVCNDIVTHTDLWATVLDASGTRPDAKDLAAVNSPGRSYLPQLRGHAVGDWKDAQISEYGNARMIRTPQYKLILRYPYGGVTAPGELYDLAADPRETTNVFAAPSHAALISGLSGRLDRFFATYSIPGKSGLDLAQQVPANAKPPWCHYAELNNPAFVPPVVPVPPTKAA